MSEIGPVGMGERGMVEVLAPAGAARAAHRSGRRLAEVALRPGPFADAAGSDVALLG